MKVDELPVISKLSTPEKILFLEDLWDSIALDESEISIPESHKRELDKRFKQYEQAPGELLTLKDLQERIEKRKNELHD